MSIDHGRPFDFGRVSSDYAKYRDIYPQELYPVSYTHLTLPTKA